MFQIYFLHMDIFMRPGTFFFSSQWHFTKTNLFNLSKQPFILKIQKQLSGCSVKRLFSKISQNAQENTCAKVFF